MSDRPLDNVDLGIDPSNVIRIQYDITKNEAGCRVPPFTYDISGSSSFQAAYTNTLSELALVLSKPEIVRLSGTGLTITIPNLIDDHILIVFPPALPNTDSTTLIVHIYAIKVDPDQLLTSEEIISCLKRLDQSSPIYKSLVSVDYKLGVYRRGDTYNTEVMESGEYNAGSILYLVESSKDDASASSIILRGTAPAQYIGTHCVAVLPNGPVPFSNSGMNEELTLAEERKEEEREEDNKEQVHASNKVKGRGMEEESMSLESRETLPECYHTLDEKETLVQQQDELTITHLSINNHEGGIVLPQNPSPIPNLDITQLSSSNNRTPSYSPSAPISGTDQKFVYPAAPSLTLQQKYFSQPSIYPHKQITRDQDFPQTIKKKDHGALLYTEGFVKELVSGNFSVLPKCEDLAQFVQLGTGGNGEVIQYFIDGREVALKYVYAGYRRETLVIWSQLDHPNIIPLLGAFVVHSVNQWHYCQVMPKMTRSLRDEFEMIGGGILPALKLKKNTAETIWHNFRIVCHQVLTAMEYLKRRGIALLDLKSSNMLTMQEHCQCESIFECPEGHHYSVKLADFDFVRSCSNTFTKCPKHPIERKDDEELCRIPGTPEYRVAPEKAWKNCGCEGVNIIGPWTDVWSFGVFLLDELCGRSDKRDIIAEAKMLSGDVKDNSPRFDPDNCNYIAEVISVLIKRTKLSSEPENETFDEVRQIIDACLKADCTERATPAKLLSFQFFSP